MKNLTVISLTAAMLMLGLTAFAETPITRDSAKPGDGQNVTFQGNPLPLVGTGIELGKPLPSSMLTANDLSPVDLADAKGKVRIISVVPSLDTPVCEEQTHQLSEENDGLDQDVELVTVSMDLPFAQKRFASEAKIENVTFLSDYKEADFGQKNGLLIKPLHLLTRTVIVTDRDNIVRYIQVVPEITTLPDLSEAMKVAKELL